MPNNIYQRGEIYWARFKVAGVEYRESLRTRSVAVAQKRLRIRREQIEDQAHFGVAGPMIWEATVVSWSAAMEREVRAKAISPKTVNRYTDSLGQCRQWLDGREVHQIDGESIRALVKGRKAQHVTNATIRRDLTAVASVLDHAIDESWIEGDTNAARTFPRKRLQERRDPIVLPTDQSIRLTVGPKSTRFGDMMLLARETGMREEEIAGLEHPMIDLAGRHVTIIGKRNRLRTVSLNRKAIEIIKRQPRYLKCQFVFWHMGEDAEGKPIAERYRNVASNFADYTTRAEARAKKADADYRRFRFHDLRHLFAVEYLRTCRGSIYDLQRELGHTTIKTTEIYLAYLTPEQATAAMSGVAQKGAHKRRSGTAA